MFLLSNNSFCQEVFDEASMSLEAGNILNETNTRVVRIDSITEPVEKKGGFNWKAKAVRFYDSNDQLIMKEYKALIYPGVIFHPSVIIFDSHKNIVLVCQNDLYGTTWRLTLYMYNDKGILTEEKYWDKKSIGKKVYDNPENPEKYTLYNSNGEKVKSWKKARRKVPYKEPNYFTKPDATEEKTE